MIKRLTTNRWLSFIGLTIFVISHIFLIASLITLSEEECSSVTCSTPSAMRLNNKQIEERRQQERKKNPPKAAIVILCRNSDLDDLEETLNQFEARFNSKFSYPYVFLNDVPFSDEFKEGVSKLTGTATIKFGLIPEEHWSIPSWIDKDKAEKRRNEMRNDGLLYGGNLAYQNMCRFNSGFFFRQKILEEYDYYWRVEPGVKFTCEINYDPFEFMLHNDKDYGFTMIVPEGRNTIPTLWETVHEFRRNNKRLIHTNHFLKAFKEDDKDDYNLCHFWSNFEIGNLNFFRSPEYVAFFDFLDKKGGFFYERWGDAPVHTLGLALLLPKDSIHFFSDIGYEHTPWYNCPSNPAMQMMCDCSFEHSEHFNNNCLNRFMDHNLLKHDWK